jgi:hypothetical protein
MRVAFFCALLKAFGTTCHLPAPRRPPVLMVDTPFISQADALPSFFCQTISALPSPFKCIVWLTRQFARHLKTHRSYDNNGIPLPRVRSTVGIAPQNISATIAVETG